MASYRTQHQQFTPHVAFLRVAFKLMLLSADFDFWWSSMILSAHASRPGQEDFNHSSTGNKTKVLKTEVAETSAAGALIHQRHRSEQRIREHFFDAEHTQTAPKDAADLHEELDLKKTWASLEQYLLKTKKNISDTTTQWQKKGEALQKYLAQEEIRDAYLRAQNEADEISLKHFRVSLESRKVKVEEHHKEISHKKKLWEEEKKIQNSILQARTNLMDVIRQQQQEIVKRAKQEWIYKELQKQRQIKQEEQEKGISQGNSKVSASMEQLDAKIARNEARLGELKEIYLQLDGVITEQQELINRDVERLNTVGESHEIPAILNRSVEEDEIIEKPASVLASLGGQTFGGGKKESTQQGLQSSRESAEGRVEASGLTLPSTALSDER